LFIADVYFLWDWPYRFLEVGKYAAVGSGEDWFVAVGALGLVGHRNTSLEQERKTSL
jgi:hypothetical protein